MKVAILNDTHCGVRNSSDIFLQYQERFYEEVFFPYLKEHNIKNILHSFPPITPNRSHWHDLKRTVAVPPGEVELVHHLSPDEAHNPWGWTYALSFLQKPVPEE